MKVISLFSGGKDSTLALYLMLQKGFEIKLFTVLPARDSMMYHYPNISLTEKQAEAMNIDIFYAEEGNELKSIKELKESWNIDGLVCGAVKSDYQRVRIEGMCHTLGLKFYAPLWDLDPSRIYDVLFDAGFRFIITSVSADGLDERWLGREITRENLGGLMDLCSNYGINPVFEGGEAETFVFDGPIFKRGLKIEKATRNWFLWNEYAFALMLTSIKK